MTIQGSSRTPRQMVADAERIVTALERAQRAAEAKVTKIDGDATRTLVYKEQRRAEVLKLLDAEFEKAEQQLCELGDMIADATRNVARPSDAFDPSSPDFGRSMDLIKRFGAQLPEAVQRSIAEKFKTCVDGLAMIKILFKDAGCEDGLEYIGTIEEAAKNDVRSTQQASDDLWVCARKHDLKGIQDATARLRNAADRYEAMSSAQPEALTEAGIEAQAEETAKREVDHFKFLNALELDGDQADGTAG